MKWISVKDRLPEYGDIVITDSILGKRFAFRHIINGEEYWVEPGGFSLKKETLEVKYWMPLPEIPKEEDA